MKTFDVVIRDKVSSKVVYAKIIQGLNATQAKQQVLRYFGIQMSQSEYKITVTPLVPYNRR